MLTEKDVLTIKDIMIILKIGKKAAYKLAKSKQFPAVKVGGFWRVHRDSLEKYLMGEVSQFNLDYSPQRGTKDT